MLAAKWECMASAEVHERCIELSTQTPVSKFVMSVMLTYIMDQRKVAHYRNQNVRFDVDLLPKPMSL